MDEAYKASASQVTLFSDPFRHLPFCTGSLYWLGCLP